MTLAVENPYGGNLSAGGSGGSFNVSTSGVDRIILVMISAEHNTVQPSVASVTASGLTFHLRKSFQYTAGQKQCIETWWAHAAAQQTATSVTVTMNAAIDAGTFQGGAISGVQNFTDPWDPNVSLPVMEVQSASATGVSTTKANTILFGFYTSSDNTNDTTAPSGWTSWTGAKNGNGSNPCDAWLKYEIVSAPQSGITATVSGVSANYGWMVDAITDAAGGSTGTLVSTEAADLIAVLGNLGATGVFAVTEAGDIVEITGKKGATGTFIVFDAGDVFVVTGDIVVADGVIVASDSHLDYVQIYQRRPL